ncbi:DUF1800 domain-containing protein [Solimonas soli]|uniref:DUF1800 domain-containing protein n=1 Tax=Solimonas soli TaxID=413479 RepID=UPI0004840AEF|nr:DUF1800 domain-containing protein [Solimonas soli]
MPASTDVAIALNRFGLGARPDEATPVEARRALVEQFSRYEPRPPAWASQPGSAAIIPRIDALRGAARAQAPDAAGEPAADSGRRSLRRDLRADYLAAADARLLSALDTPTPFVERLVHFWSNHFAVSVDKVVAAPLAGPHELEAIRPHVLGRFEDLLLAAETHPAMQLYLDQLRSVGPDSMAVQRVEARRPERKLGLNENLAREILELHTLGVRSGYTQADVTEFARALTGWSVAGLGRGAARDTAPPGSFEFRAALHEPGTRTILGKTYSQRGEAQARAVLHDLAGAPATATHIATKLARHFVADTPPPALVARLADTFRKSGGDLPAVYRALIDADEAWAPAPAKFKTPWDWTVSALRGLGLRDLDRAHAAPILAQLGQPPWKPGSPAGYDDIAASWAAPDALLRRVELAQRFAARLGDRLDARALAERLLPGVLTGATRKQIARAESPATALALLLVAPEFQRR